MFKRTTSLAASALLAIGTAFTVSPATAQDPFNVKILHINDHHSHLTANSRMSLKLDGTSTRVRSGGFARIVTLFDQLSKGRTNVLKLHAGDAITGDLYYTLFKGKADAALMNEVCFDAFALGNHEFDDGDAGLAQFLDFLKEGPCQTDVVAANVVPKVDVSPLAQETSTDYFKPYTIKTVNGEQIGIIGIDIAKKTKESSSPDADTQFLDEAKTAQKYIDDLEAQGINKIVLLTHYQYLNDLALVQKLRGVDVIIGGDSHSLLGDFTTVGLSSEGPYPTVLPNASGQTACVAQAWQYAQIVGELDVTFDGNGHVIGCQGTPHMPIADSFKRKNKDGERVELEGHARKTALKVIKDHPNVRITHRDTDAKAVLAEYAGQVDAMKAEKIGQAATTLCLERIPGQGKSTVCKPEDTAIHGSDITTIVAHAFRTMSKTSQIAIQNGGGVRTDLSEGAISIGDAYTLMPFANTLVELDMTGSEIRMVLEEALDYALSEGGSTGAYPYAAGLRWSVDAAAPMGQRLSNLEFKGKTDQDWAPLTAGQTYRIVTNSYIAGGRDGYKTFGTVTKEGRVTDTYLDYAQSFVDYVKARSTLEKLPYSDYSTQAFTK